MAMPLDRSSIKKGVFLTGTPHPARFVKRQPLPPEYAHFEAAAAEADKLTGVPSLSEIEQRMARAKEKLEALRAAVRRRR
jgi:hypothetical protein